jgi:hypothetical protein
MARRPEQMRLINPSQCETVHNFTGESCNSPLIGYFRYLKTRHAQCCVKIGLGAKHMIITILIATTMNEPDAPIDEPIVDDPQMSDLNTTK